MTHVQIQKKDIPKGEGADLDPETAEGEIEKRGLDQDLIADDIVQDLETENRRKKTKKKKLNAIEKGKSEVCQLSRKITSVVSHFILKNDDTFSDQYM